MFGAIFVVAGLAFVTFGLWVRQRSQQATLWPSVEGEIIESHIEKSTDDSNDSFRVRYRYAVAGRSFESRQLTLAGYSTDTASLERLLRKYPAGASVQVFHDPAKPADAVLENATTSFWLALVIGGALCAGIGLLLP